MDTNEREFKVLQDKVLINIEISDDKTEIRFFTNDGKEYLMYHDQDCCETVELEEIHGDIANLLGNPVVQATETSNKEQDTDEYESVTWTFYNISTIRGSVTLRWCGESNGYYSEEVDFVEIIRDKNEKQLA